MIKPHLSATAQRRQRQIEDCLYENLLHTPWQSISVADICRQVGISRKAYYNYYRDKESCFTAFLDRTLEEIMLHVTQALSDNATPLESAIVLLSYWREQKPLLDVLVRNNLLYALLSRSAAYCNREDHSLLESLSTTEIPMDEDILCCYTNVQLTLLLNWYGRGFDTPVEEMAKKLLRILHEPLIPQGKS